MGIRAPNLKVNSSEDVYNIIRKGFAEGFTGVRLEIVPSESLYQKACEKISIGLGKISVYFQNQNKQK